MKLERTSKIAGIIAVIFPIVWSIWVYFRPSESQPQPLPSLIINGDHNVLSHGDNNVVSASLESSSPKGIDQEAALSKLTTGISRAFLEAQFGPANFDELDAELKASNLIFVFPRFFLQAILSQEGKVVFYSVTTRTTDFRPAIPNLGGQLLQSRYADFGDAEHIYSHMSSKYYEYAEKIYIGNVGNYRNFYLGYCPAGVLPKPESFMPMVLDRDGPSAHKEFRTNSTPNCFGIGDIHGDENEILERFGMGINYYVARDLQ